MKEQIIDWIKNWFKKESGGAQGIVINISGGKDSTVAAKLCVEAVGPDKVFGLIQPNGEQKDIEDAKRVCDLLGIPYAIINIKKTYDSFLNEAVTYVDNIQAKTAMNFVSSTEAQINIAPRIRMTNAYNYAQTLRYRVCGTGNLSERLLGYFTKFGDGACDFNPIGNLTKTAVVALGDELRLPYDLVHKPPSDGLCGQTDEERFGFTYEQLDEYIIYLLNGITPTCALTEDVCEIIKNKIELAQHKLRPIPVF